MEDGTKGYESEYIVSFKDGGADMDMEILALSREDALDKFYDSVGDTSGIWDVVCW